MKGLIEVAQIYHLDFVCTYVRSLTHCGMGMGFIMYLIYAYDSLRLLIGSI